jgi:hypothetical protein
MSRLSPTLARVLEERSREQTDAALKEYRGVDERSHGARMSSRRCLSGCGRNVAVFNRSGVCSRCQRGQK